VILKNQKLANEYHHPCMTDLFNMHNTNSMNSFQTAADSGNFQMNFSF